MPPPDLNSLPPSPSPLSRAMSYTNSGDVPPLRGESPSNSPRSPSISLQAAATLNAGLHQSTRRSSSSSLSRNQPSPQRRRSQVLMNLQLADPSIPAPGEMVSETSTNATSGFRTASPVPLSNSPLMLPMRGDPHHNRTPSLGELHQSMEQEQEFQVNRLLQMIRQQQLQLQQLQAGQNPSAVADESSDTVPPALPIQPSSTASSAPQSAVPGIPATGGSLPRSPGFPHHPRSSFDLARADLQRRSRTPSRGTSPRLRSTSISGESAGAAGGDQFVLGSRDESAFYQAETQMLVRENQMLRHRVRELERQLSDAGSNPSGSALAQPLQASRLIRSTSVSEEESAVSGEQNGATPQMLPIRPAVEPPKDS